MPAAKDWNQAADEDRRISVNNAFAHRPQFAQIWRDFDELRSDFREGADALCMIIIGAPGVGKSTLVRHYAEANPSERIETEAGWSTRTPVLYVSLKGDSQKSSAAQTILKKLLRTDRATGRTPSLTDRIEAQLRKQRTELIILDEFQHLSDTGADKTQNKTADWVKGLTKETNVPIVMVGMDSLGKMVDANAGLDSITRLRRALGEFDYKNIRSRKAYLTFLEELDSIFPFNERSGFALPETAEKLYLASSGNLRSLCLLLRWAAKAAIKDKSLSVEDKHLEYAYDKFGGLGGMVKENPFSEAAYMRAAG